MLLGYSVPPSVVVIFLLLLVGSPLMGGALIEVLHQGAQQLGGHLVLVLAGVVKHVSVSPSDEVLLPPQSQGGSCTPRKEHSYRICFMEFIIKLISISVVIYGN